VPFLSRSKAMKASDQYRNAALRLCQRANGIRSLDVRVEYESLAFAYMCLAEQADREAEEWAECRDLPATK
jgi:hypothetical protein